MNTLSHIVSKLGLLVCIIALCVGCRDDNYNYIPDIKTYAFYETIDEPGLKKPDAGAIVFYYCRICIDDLSTFDYLGDGKFVKSNSPDIIPDEKFMIGENGAAFFIPEDKHGSAMIVIESNFYKGEIKTACFSSPSNGAGFYAVFMPCRQENVPD